MNVKTSNGQVQLSKLIFTHNWEDPAVDERALKIKQGDAVFAITSGGCNALGFLRFNPATIHCVDINPAQNHLVELKKAAFSRLDHGTMWKFFGLDRCRDRYLIFEELKNDLSPEALRFWKENFATVKNGIIMNGRYEKFVKLAGKLISLLEGPNKVRTFFTLQTAEEQARFYEERWDNKRWRWIFRTMFSKKRLAKKGLASDYFHFDDGTSSFSESFYKRAAHVMKDIPVQTNYFIALYLLGHYLDHHQLPEYLKAENFDSIKQTVGRIKTVSADSKHWLKDQHADMFDAFALSNICELMDDTDTRKLFAHVIRTAKPGARIIFRNLMIPREVPEDMREVIIKDETLSRELQQADRSFVYGKVAAYVIKK